MKKNSLRVLLCVGFVIGLIICSTVILNAAVKYGDNNNDGLINSTDEALVQRYILGIINLSDITSADLNGDKKINTTDIALLQRYLLGAISEFPINSVVITPTTTGKPTNDNTDKVLIPDKNWDCGMSNGIPKPEKGNLVFEIDLKIDKAYDVGKTQYGYRKAYVIKGGNISSSKLNGTIQTGGLDFQLELSNGVQEIEQILVIKTNDNKYILIRNAGTGISQNDVRMVYGFEAPNSSNYTWMNTGKFVGRRIVDLNSNTIKISIYDVSNVTIDTSNSLKITKPENVQSQSWDYRKAQSGERKGSELITENVSLASSQSVGETKKGNRNIIPITGGNVTGKLTAKIVAAGADYQNLSNPMTIDAKYLWETSDGEIIIVRNAGQFGGLVPTFEAKESGKYSYLNKNLYLSSDPSSGGSGVKIVFYESTK